MVVAILGVLSSAWLLVAERANAMPRLQAAIDWQGECDDRASLSSELTVRGAELSEVPASDTALKLSIAVRRTAAEHLLAEIELSAAGSRESRQVEARDCLALRRAVAWVLGVFAEEREAAERSREPSTKTFPAASPAPAAAPAKKQPEPPAPSPPPPAPSVPPTAKSRPCATPGPRFALGSELLVGFGFVDTLALGPSLLGSYRPCASFLPGIAVGASHLVSFGYELDARAIRIERTSGQVGAWLPLGSQLLRAGISVEAGRIRATGAASTQGGGGSSSTRWLALVVPLRLVLPVVSPSLTASVGVDGVYAPLSYPLRYSSGQVLGQPAHFELRGAAGLSGHF